MSTLANKSSLIRHALAGALLLALAGSAIGATAVVAGTSESTVNKSISVADNTEVKDVDSVNGAIRIGDGASVRSAETVNGSIRFGVNARTGSAETVNGRIEAGAGFVAEGNLETVNGSITLGSGASVGGSIESVNGSIELDQAAVGKDLQLVNGSIETRATRIGGDVVTVNGSVDLLGGTIVEGDLIVKKSRGSNSWWGNSKKGPTLVIGANSEIRGTIRVENEYTKLYVDPSAKVGGIEGVEAQTRAER
jgi:hypothetical protein